MVKRKLTITGWILEVSLSDGRIVTLDVDDDAARAIDDFLTGIESNKEVED